MTSWLEASEPGVTSLQFADSFSDNPVKLFEMDDKVLEELLADGGSLAIKGNPNEEAVLCTASRTYLLRLAESSNTLLLAPGQLPKAPPAEGPPADITISSSASAYFELVPTAPRASTLPELLALCPYPTAAEAGEASGDMDMDGAEVEGAAQPAKRLTWAQLEASVQCSGAELQAALQRARALEVGDGRWSVLEAQYEQDVCGSLLDLLVEKEWPLDALPLGEAVETMCAPAGTYDELAVRHCARALSTSRLSGWAEWVGALHQETLALDVEALCRFRAHELLLACDRWPQAKFLEEWADQMPQGVTPDAGMLRGLAVVVDDGGRHLQALPLESLPATAAPRFQALFKVKPAWLLAELEPYLEGVVGPDKKGEAIVLQHARCVTASDGSRSYVART